MNKLLKNLEGKENRRARFKTVIALTLNDKETPFTGICEGNIIEKKGDEGFG